MRWFEGVEEDGEVLHLYRTKDAVEIVREVLLNALLEIEGWLAAGLLVVQS
jgi:hypothetical protein